MVCYCSPRCACVSMRAGVRMCFAVVFYYFLTYVLSVVVFMRSFDKPAYHVAGYGVRPSVRPSINFFVSGSSYSLHPIKLKHGI